MEQFNKYFIDTLKNRYAEFDGRATRSEYWYYFLFYLLLIFTAKVLDTYVLNPILGMTIEEASQGGFIQVIIALALIVPTIALGIRRLHDIGKTGWWMLIGLVPIVGFVVLMYFYITDSQPETNKYGTNPKLQFSQYLD